MKNVKETDLKVIDAKSNVDQVAAKHVFEDFRVTISRKSLIKEKTKKKQEKSYSVPETKKNSFVFCYHS